MKIVIIEDEKLTANDLASSIVKVQPDTEIIAILHSVKQSIIYFESSSHKVDLIFSDIQLGDGTSFDVFSQVHIQVPVIFCTAFDEYALDAFRANGIDYILKPFTDETVELALKKYHSLKGNSTLSSDSFEDLLKVLSNKKKDSQGSVLVHHKDKIIPVPIKEIAFFYLKNGIGTVVTGDKKIYHLNKTLDDLEKIVGASFFRVNRQFLINRNAVIDISSALSRKSSLSLKIPTEETVLVSKEKLPQLLQWLSNEA